MSEQIFNRAKAFSEKVLKCMEDIKKLPGIDKRRTVIDYRYYLDKNNTIYKSHKNAVSSKFLWNGGVAMGGNIAREFYNINTNCQWCTSISRNLVQLTEFQEDLDFQLSTLLDDKELYEYYLACFYMSSGYIGAIRRDLHHNTINAIRDHVARILERGY